MLSNATITYLSSIHQTIHEHAYLTAAPQMKPRVAGSNQDSKCRKCRSTILHSVSQFLTADLLYLSPFLQYSQKFTKAYVCSKNNKFRSTFDCLKESLHRVLQSVALSTSKYVTYLTFIHTRSLQRVKYFGIRNFWNIIMSSTDPFQICQER